MGKGISEILQRRSEAEIRSLINKAGRGAGLSLGHSIEMSNLTPKLMSDPELMFMMIDVLSEDHQKICAEVTGKTILIVVDSLLSDLDEVVLEDLKWPALLRVLLINSQEKYGVFFKIDEIDESHLSIKLSKKNFFSQVGPPAPIPFNLIKLLEKMASKTYVPESETSRLKGAGAGLTDND